MKTLLATALAAVVFLASALALAGDREGRIGEWERLEEERMELQGELREIEGEHQNFVEAIENLKERTGVRRERERLLRENLQVVEVLEGLQRRIGALDLEQELLRGDILEDLEARRQELEREIRESSPGERLQLVSKLNELQRDRRRFSAPLPERDQRRIDEILAMAREVEEDHPRAMVSVADELEDAEEELLARLAGLDRQIAELQRAQRLYRRSRNFGEVQSFFDEEQRNRRIGTYGQASRSAEEERSESAPAAGGDNAEFDDFHEFDDSIEMDEGMSEPDSGAPGVGDGPGGGESWDGGQEDFAAPELEEREEEEQVELRDPLGPDQGGEGRVLRGPALERDLARLRRERREIEEQAAELRREAENLRRRAREER